MESKNHQEKIIICFRCKIKMNKTELKDVYKCPACDLVEEKEEMTEKYIRDKYMEVKEKRLNGIISKNLLD